MIVAYSLWGLLLFLIFTIAYFPYADVLAAKLAPMGLRLSYAQAHFAPPLGVRLQNVKISAAQSARGPGLESRELTLSPALTSLLLGQLALAAGGELYGGHAQVFVARTGGASYSVRFEASALDLAKLARLADTGTSLTGKLSARGLLDLSQAGTGSAMGNLEFSGRNVGIRFGTGILSVTFTELAGAFALKPGVLDVRRLNGRGPELALDAHGAVHLAPSLNLSTVNVTCHLAPTPAGRARLGVFLRLLPHPPGATPYLIRGPLMMPSIS
jgi:type II secretion system protein N